MLNGNADTVAGKTSVTFVVQANYSTSSWKCKRSSQKIHFFQLKYSNCADFCTSFFSTSAILVAKIYELLNLKVLYKRLGEKRGDI